MNNIKQISIGGLSDRSFSSVIQELCKQRSDYESEEFFLKSLEEFINDNKFLIEKAFHYSLDQRSDGAYFLRHGLGKCRVGMTPTASKEKIFENLSEGCAYFINIKIREYR